MTSQPYASLNTKQTWGYAGFISRLFSEVIDVILISFSFTAVAWFLSVTTAMFQVQTVLGISLFSAIPWLNAFTDWLFGPASVGLFTGMYVLAYHIFFWTLTGQTPGKALMGIRIISAGGGRVSPFRSLLRFLGYFLSALPFFLGFLWILVDDDRRGWHDRLAGTFVIYNWAARPDERFLVEEIRQLAPISSAHSGKPGREP